MKTMLSTGLPMGGLRARLRWLPLVLVGFPLAGCGEPLATCSDVEEQTLYTGEWKVLYVCFTGAERAELVVTASSSNVDVGTTHVDGWEVKVAAIAPGNATITVQAEDLDGRTVEIEFGLQVPNRLPYATVDVFPTTNMLTESRREYRVDEYFADLDGHLLSFNAAIDDSTVATAVLEEGRRLVIFGLLADSSGQVEG